MRAPRTITWKRPELTTIKHCILRGYLEQWLPEVLQRCQSAYIVDGFCGPGNYTGGEPGSPLIAIDVLHRCISADPELLHKAKLVFIDEDDRRCNYLYDLIERKKRYQPALANLIPRIECGPCVRKLDRCLTRLEKWYALLPPMFVLLDPFGFSDIPMSIIGRVMKHPQSEVLITFMYEETNRFLSFPDESMQCHLTDLFGTMA